MTQRRKDCKELRDVCSRLGARPRFPVYMGEELLKTPVEDLELTVRSFNCLRRAGMMTVGDIVGSIDSRADLLKIRNLGMKSADEIMDAIMEYQFTILPEGQRSKYLRRVEELNSSSLSSKIG